MCSENCSSCVLYVVARVLALAVEYCSSGVIPSSGNAKQGPALPSRSPAASAAVTQRLMRLVLEDLIRAHRDRVDSPPVLLLGVVEVGSVHPGIGAVLVVPHREEAMFAGRPVRGVLPPDLPILGRGARPGQEQDGNGECGPGDSRTHGPASYGVNCGALRAR